MKSGRISTSLEVASFLAASFSVSLAEVGLLASASASVQIFSNSLASAGASTAFELIFGLRVSGVSVALDQ